MTNYRRATAKEIREVASRLANDRQRRKHLSNGDGQRYASANCAMSFAKGPEHGPDTGVACDAGDYENFREAKRRLLIPLLPPWLPNINRNIAGA